MSENDLLDSAVTDNGRVGRRSIVVLVFILLNFLCLAAAYPLSLSNIESIIASGAAFGLFSLGLLVLALAMRKYYLLVLSLLGVAFVASIFLFIAINKLSPSEAKEPVPTLILYLGLGYLVPFSWSLWKEFRLPGR